VEVDDFETIERQFWADFPEGVGAAGSEPAPLLLSFHGQFMDATYQAGNHDFLRLGREHGFLTVYPQGIDDSDPSAGEAGDAGTGWNVGTAGDDSTCDPKETAGTCYLSCRRLGLCGKCNWNTCYDETLFARRVIEAVAGELCVDLSRVYLQGESNGGMLVWHLMQDMPDVFAAVVPWFGLPLLGYTFGRDFGAVRAPEQFGHTAILQLHGRQDHIIPSASGIAHGDGGGWIYEPLDKVHAGWAAVHGCQRRLMPVATRWDGGPSNLSCREFPGCASGRRIMRCMYNGEHGDYPSPDPTGDEITVWFMLQFRLPHSNGTAVAGGRPAAQRRLPLV
jgi:poly(3-hydroxybutyrate) depolymerase